MRRGAGGGVGDVGLWGEAVLLLLVLVLEVG